MRILSAPAWTRQIAVPAYLLVPLLFLGICAGIATIASLSSVVSCSWFGIDDRHPEYLGHAMLALFCCFLPITLFAPSLAGSSWVWRMAIYLVVLFPFAQDVAESRIPRIYYAIPSVWQDWHLVIAIVVVGWYALGQALSGMDRARLGTLGAIGSLTFAFWSIALIAGGLCVMMMLI